MPNRTDGTVTAEEWQRFDALKPSVVKLRTYSLSKAILDYISASKVDTIIFRPSSDGDFDVADRVHELQYGIVQLLQWGFRQLLILPDSEPNLGSRPVPSDYWAKISQVIAHPNLRDMWNDQILVGSPPMAVMQGEEEWYEAAGDLMSAFDRICAHGYGQLDAGLLHRTLALAHQFGPQVVLDEVGDSHPTASEELKATSVASYLRIAADSGVDMATLFLMGGTPEWSGFIFSPDTIRRCIAPTLEYLTNAPA